MTKQEKQKLEQFLEYVQDKVEDCYKKETEEAYKYYLREVKIIDTCENLIQFNCPICGKSHQESENVSLGWFNCECGALLDIDMDDECHILKITEVEIGS
jgi:hypothetical protein